MSVTRADNSWPEQRVPDRRPVGVGWILFTALVLGLLAGAGAALVTL